MIIILMVTTQVLYAPLYPIIMASPTPLYAPGSRIFTLDYDLTIFDELSLLNLTSLLTGIPRLSVLSSLPIKKVRSNSLLMPALILLKPSILTQSRSSWLLW
ncbi:hypothetical protein B0T21DRAFT_431975 [Apiosordaria backusii]|uniref:Uncharacterized protein n=1 Tax=Apiosordaria backusii TaxID=314023 RepID=A0AA40DID6_9PEZI|nr:hypothetical protein B0T21DRAFT_431975 [Apiosordaria backusii]